MDDRFNELREKNVYGVNLAVKRMIEKNTIFKRKKISEKKK